MSDRKPTLGMEPSERRALGIIALAGEQSDEIVRLQRALDDVTEQCRTSEHRVRENCAAIAEQFARANINLNPNEDEATIASSVAQAIANAIRGNWPFRRAR